MLFLSAIFAVTVQAKTIEIVIPWPPGGGIDFQGTSLVNSIAKLYPDLTVKKTHFNSCAVAMNHAVSASKSHPTYVLGDIGDLVFRDKTVGSRCPPLADVPTPIVPMTRLGYVPIFLCHPARNADKYQQVEKQARINVGYPSTTAFNVVAGHMQDDRYRMIPYNSTPQITTAAAAGDLDMFWIGGHTAIPMMDKGEAKCVAISSDSKLKGLPSLSAHFGRPIPTWDSMVFVSKVGGEPTADDLVWKAARSQAFSDALNTRNMVNGSLEKINLMDYLIGKEKILLDPKAKKQ